MKFYKSKNKYNKQKGFTLIETLIAILILTIAITGPVYISSLSFRNNIQSRDNISAQYLAEEVIEVLKNKKDARALTKDKVAEWLIDDNNASSITDDAICFNKNGESLNKCVMNWSESDQKYIFKKCPDNASCPNMSFDKNSTTVVYGKDDVGYDQSKFIREFYFERGVNDTEDPDSIYPEKEANLIVNIKWLEKGIEKTYTLNEKFYPINYKTFFRN